jgi:excisionase family DNA binding protein
MMGFMSTTAEIRPGMVAGVVLDSLESALAFRSVGETPRLVGPDRSSIELPKEIYELLVDVVAHLKAGDGVSIVALHEELTTVEAADILNVSRPHLIKQLEAGVMPFRMVGSHRRIRLADILAYRDRQDVESRAALDELTRQAEDLGLYD